MPSHTPKVTIHPPPGRPSWGGQGNLPLIYLGWGRRDFARHPLPVHCDLGTSYFLLFSGQILLTSGQEQSLVRGPKALLIDSDCLFGITQTRSENVNILVWVWKGPPLSPELRPATGGHTALDIRKTSLNSLKELHTRCRKEVAISDGCLSFTLPALRHLLEAEILRASRPSSATGDLRWELAHSWMMSNLSIHTPVPALCDYLSMSPSSLNRFFRRQIGHSPGSYFRHLKLEEANRLVKMEKWQVKAAAYKLGYSHPNDLSRAIARTRKSSRLPE